MSEPLTRRQLLRRSALIAATFPTAAALTEGWSLATVAHAQGAGLAAVPIHLELVTVTDTQAAITWFTGDPSAVDQHRRPTPVAAPGRLLLGTDPTALEEVASHEATAYHYVELDGLQPGTTYYFRAESNGVAATPTALDLADPDPSNRFTFTTQTPPPGRLLGRVLWCNDVHIAEQVSGLIYSDNRLPGGGFPPGFAVDPENPYWRFMIEACLTEGTARGADLLLVNGDLTNEAEPFAVEEARRHFDGFGRLGGGTPTRDGTSLVVPGGPRAYYATRGNHDRTHTGDLYAGCSPVPGTDRFDCFADAFGDGFEPGSTHFSVQYGDPSTRYRFVGLDSCGLEGRAQMPQSELDYLEAELDRGDQSFVLFHHPGSDTARLGLSPQDSQRLQDSLAGRANVAGVYNGHTHRNETSFGTRTGDVPYFEMGATKEYPGGYTIISLYEGGYRLNFWKAKAPEARAWSERSRGEYLGLYPYLTLGALADRNHVRAVDASFNRRAARRAAERRGLADARRGG